MKKVAKQEEPKKDSKVIPASTVKEETIITENHHQGHNGTVYTESSVPTSQTNGHADKVDPPAEQAPQNPTEQL
ncbi:hypothetical protein BIW11_06992 [Tropilaelaps mercedesae]|uniref:Uncharacterized protein n=1 Tax=Tropilaelaps mercedesae TaxID=418985 RepID=A0A1V9XVP7_9ACAR|nr:hypothetical protein BIW11_06992 [Tropilaelaps mercedesae]